jgi:N-ethylmaleimide reductase
MTQAPATSPLLTPYRLGELALPNRMVMAPMSRARASADGLATASTAIYYAQRASAGLLISEGAQPSLLGQSNPFTPGLHSDAAVEAWRPVTAAVHANGGRIFAQVMHGGRVGHPSNVGYTPVAPSAVRLEAELFTASGPQPAPVPRALSSEEVGEEVAVFGAAATRAITAGFDGVELHGANGYLIQQFLSTNVNRRTDAYGGSTASRIRFAVEAVGAAVAAVGASRVGIRLSPGTAVWGVEEDNILPLYGALLVELDKMGIAYVHLLDTGGPEVFDHLRERWSRTFIMNPSAGIEDEPAGLEAGERWLERGADLVSFGRAFLANPDLVERFRTRGEIAVADGATYYGGGDSGYIDYPARQY